MGRISPAYLLFNIWREFSPLPWNESFMAPSFSKYPCRAWEKKKKYHEDWGDLQPLKQFAFAIYGLDYPALPYRNIDIWCGLWQKTKIQIIQRRKI